MKRIIDQLPFILAILPLLLSGCEEGSLRRFSSESSLISLQSSEMVDYDNLKATYELKGEITLKNINSSELLSFHSTVDCTSEPLGSVQIENFSAQGAQLSVPLDQTTSVYAKTSLDSRCFFVTEVTPQTKPVRPATFSRTTPASPSSLSFEPGIYGNAFPLSAQVTLYKDSACTQQIGQSSRAHFQNVGIQVQLTPETTTNIFSIVTDPLGQKSDCTELTSYRHSLQISPNPQFILATPASPSNTIDSPKIKGQLDPTIKTVKLFKDSACSQQIGEGAAADYQASGLAVTLEGNATTLIYAVAYDENQNPSGCAFQTSYTMDTTPPGVPTFISASPESPTRLTTLPKIVGTLPDEATHIRLFNAPGCQQSQMIGFGTKANFSATGVTANLTPNMTNEIYGASVDAAGNQSACTSLTSYRHNTIPPLPPMFSATNPTSPTNQTTSPMIIGAPSDLTVSLQLFKDAACTDLIGQGTANEFSNAGIQVSVLANTVTVLYALAFDAEGNQTDCTSLGTFAHSDRPAPAPTFISAVPNSPTRLTNKPLIIGTAPASVVRVDIYSDDQCVNLLAGASRLTMVTAGIQITIPENAVTQLYAVSSDIYGNTSPCVYFSSYTHSNQPPQNPVLMSYSPLSPNNITSFPIFIGTAYQNPGSPLVPTLISFYEGDSCISKIGEGSLADFQSTGITLAVPENSIVPIYAKSFDAALNGSACTFMTNYVYNNRKPGRPIFISTTPESPSYTAETSIRGTFGPSADFMNRVSVNMYHDSSCLIPISTDTPSAFESTGVRTPVPANATTVIYANSINEVGTKSDCSQMVNFRHYDTPLNGLQISNQLSGELRLSWFNDNDARPSPTFTVKRSVSPTGPFTNVASGLASPSYNDNQVNEGVTYYYKVQATNSTGSNLDSSVVSATSSANVNPPINTLSATAGFGQVTLNWTGFSENMYFKVLRSATPGGPYQILAQFLKSATYKDVMVTNNAIYYYVVQGINPSGQSAFSNEISVQPLGLPPPVTQIWLEAKANNPSCGGGPGVDIRWLPTDYVTDYEVFETVLGSSNLLTTTTGTGATDCNPTGGTETLYSVNARWGNMSAGNSPTVSFLAGGSTVLSAFAGSNHVELKWTPASFATSFNVYRSNSAEGPFTLLASGVTAFNHTDTTVSQDTGYYYYVQGYQSTIPAGYPSTILPAVPSAAAANTPNSLGLSFDANGNPQLAWTAVNPVNRFLVYRATNAAGPFSLIGYSAANTYVDSASLADGIYYYRVSAQWGNTESSSSNTVNYRKGKISTFTATAASAHVGLSWSAMAGATSYRIERATDRNGPFTTIQLPTGTTYNDTSAVAGQGYHYAVTPIFADGTEGQRSALASGMRSGTGLAPSGISIVGRNTSSITLGWAPVPGASTYRVYRSNTLAGTYSLQGSTPSPSLIIASLTARTLYYFKVEAVVSGVGTMSTPYSAATLGAAPTPTATAGDNSLFVQWNAVTGVSTYSLKRTTDLINFTTVATGLTTLSYTDNSVTNGQTYFYRVTTHYTGLGSVDSDLSEPLIPGFVPLTPQGLSVVGNYDGVSLTLSWSPSLMATGYYVYMSTDPAGPFDSPLMSSSSASLVAITGLNPDTKYYFKVSARNGSLESGQSSMLAVQTGSSPPAPLVRAPSATSVDISWTAVAGAATYDLLRRQSGGSWEILVPNLATTSYLDSSVLSTRSYYYHFVPRTADGTVMAPSLSSALVIPGPQPVAPPDLFVSAANSTSANLAWVAAPNVNAYEIFRTTTSGSGYTSIGTTTASETTFTDSTVTPGTVYYYIVRSINSSGRSSPDSVERGLSLNPGPTSFAGVNAGAAIQLSWDSLPGATGYLISRSLSAGGPYGPVGSSAANALTDTNVEAGNTYYYVLTAIFADGSQSLRTSEISVTKSGSLNFTHPVEMIDRGLASSSASNKTFARSETRIQTDDYDGTVTYRWEIVARNSDAIDRNVKLVDANENILAQITVPGAVYDSQRLEVPLTLNPGVHQLRLSLDQTDSIESLAVLNSRILIRQQNATKTKIYFPLLSSSRAPSSEDFEGFTDASGSLSEEIPASALNFVRQVTKMQQLIAFNAWELDVLSAASGASQGFWEFRNLTASQNIPGLATEISQDSIRQSRTFINEGTNLFGTSNENHQYALNLRCSKNCATNSIRLYKAGLWVKLENLSRLHLQFRLAQSRSDLMSPMADRTHSLRIVPSEFTNPQFRLQATASSTISYGLDLTLQTAGTSDSGSASLSDISGSTLTFWPGSSARQSASSGLVSLSDNERLSVLISPTGTGVQLHGAFLDVEVAP